MKFVRRIIPVLVMILFIAGCAKKEVPADDTVMRVGSLKGPTSMGLVSLMKKNEEGTSEGKYDFTMAVMADEIAAGLTGGTLDAALIPANLASVLYNKTNGGIVVLNINTLGVLYAVTGDETVKSVSGLAGKTVLSTGQGTTPELSLRYLMSANGITDYEIEFVSEASEAAAILAKDPSRVAVLPQPFVTAACAQNDKLRIAFSLSEAWDQTGSDSKMVTGVTVVRREFLDEHPEVTERFMKEHAQSVEDVQSDYEKAASLIAEYGIVEKAPVALKALPYCNLVSISGSEMKTALSGYLTVLFDQNAKSIGGALPSDDFYYGK